MQTIHPMDFRAFYLRMRAVYCDLEHHRELSREALMDLDVDLHAMKLQLDGFSVGIKDLDQPFREMKELIPPFNFQGFDAYKSDKEFMAKLDKVWGRTRPFWQERNGLFYCQIYNRDIERYQDIALGFDKGLVIQRIETMDENQ